MEIIFLFSIVLSIFLMLFNDVNAILLCMQNACESAVKLSINLIGIYSLWLGLLEIADKCGLSEKLAKLLHPITSKLFQFKNKETEQLVAINLSGNILGLGNASTPSGILAMQYFDNHDGKINRNMICLLLLNICSLQIIPTTIIGLRLSNSSLSATDIILPNFLSSYITTFIGIGIFVLIEKAKNKKNNKSGTRND